MLVRNEVLFVELKSDTGKLTDDQKRWDNALLFAGANYSVWRPRDWDKVHEKLSR